MIASGANINETYKSEKGNSPLHVAASHGKIAKRIKYYGHSIATETISILILSRVHRCGSFIAGK